MVVLTEQIVRGKTRIDRLDEVKNLNLWGQDIDDVQVLARMTGVEVLSLSVNRISSLKDFRHCQQLKELYLRKNYISDLMDLQYLVPLTQLQTLWLCDNPCADHPLYRPLVARLLPSVEKLDNMEVTPQERDAAFHNPEVARIVASNPQLSAVLPSTPPPASPPPPQPASPSARSGGYGNGHSNGGSPYAGSRPVTGPPASEGGIPRSPSAAAGAMVVEPTTRRRKNILYACMALVTELDEDDLVYVKREIEQRLGQLGK